MDPLPSSAGGTACLAFANLGSVTPYLTHFRQIIGLGIYGMTPVLTEWMTIYSESVWERTIFTELVGNKGGNPFSSFTIRLNLSALIILYGEIQKSGSSKSSTSTSTGKFLIIPVLVVRKNGIYASKLLLVSVGSFTNALASVEVWNWTLILNLLILLIPYD